MPAAIPATRFSSRYSLSSITSEMRPRAASMSARLASRMAAQSRSRLSAMASSRAFFVSLEALQMVFHAALVFFRMSMVVIHLPSFARKRVPTGLPATMS